MSQQATLPTSEDLLEQPAVPVQPKGLVPRQGLFVALGIFVFMLIGFAFYDLVLRKPDATALQVEAAASKKAMAVESLGKQAPATDITEIATQQVARAPLPPASMSAAINPPSDVTTRNAAAIQNPNGGMPATGPTPKDEREAQSSLSPIFAITGAGGSGGVSGAVEGFLEGAEGKAIENAKSDILAATKAITNTQGGASAEMAKVLAAVQGQAKGVGKDQQWLKDNASEGSHAATFARPPASPWLVFQGTRLPIVVREAINSDLPGSITALTTSPIYDSINQCAVLIPSGTRIIGSYSADIRPGQSRVLMGFSRMIFPDGRSLELNGAQGVDSIGAVGAEGDVNNHWIKQFGYSFALALLSTGVSSTAGPSSITVGQNGQSATTTVAGQVLNQIATSAMSRNSNIPPTITLEVGSRLFVTVVRDLALPPLSRTHCK